MGTHPIFESDFDCLTEPEMDIGGHCTFMTCNKLDFLPIKCRFCLSDFCEDHMTPERHSCANLPQSSSASTKSTAPLESLPMPKLCRIRLKRKKSKTKKVLTWRH